MTKAWLVFDLPEGVELMATNAYIPWNSVQRSKIEGDGKADARCEVPCSPHPTTLPRGPGRGAWFSRYRPPAIWLGTDLPPGNSPGKVYYCIRWLAKDEKDPSQSQEHDVALAVLPKPESPQPKIALSGVMGRFILNYNRVQTEVPAMITGMIRQLGFNYFMGYIPIPCEEKGLQRWAETVIHNGYEAGVAAEIPAEIAYKSEGKILPRAVAPWAIYRRHPWVVENVFTAIRKQVADGDITSAWSNWEPYAYQMNGDYSEGSMREFIGWSKLPENEVTKGWPADTIKAHPREWKRFRSWELGEVTRTLAEVMDEAGRDAGVTSRFAVGMSNDAVWATTDEHGCSAQEWGDMPYVLQTWQYYYVASSEGPFPVSDRSCAPHCGEASGPVPCLRGVRQLRAACAGTESRTERSRQSCSGRQSAFCEGRELGRTRGPGRRVESGRREALRDVRMAAPTLSGFQKAVAEAQAQVLPADAQGDNIAALRAQIANLAGKVVVVKESAAPISVDGILDEPAWKKASVQSGFLSISAGRPARAATEFRLVRHGDMLYVGADCFQDMTKPPVARNPTRDGSVWYDDAIEIHLNRPEATDPKDMAVVIVNAKGEFFDMKQGDKKWDGDVKTAYKWLGDRYVLEFSVPLAEIGLGPAMHRLLRFNIVRDVQHPDEISGWFPAVRANMDLNVRGWMLFE